jgi:hypothetical protein
MTTTTTPRPQTTRTPDDSGRWNTRAAGAFYLLTFAASIPALLLITPVLLTSNLLTFFGHNTIDTAGSMLAALPIAAWELSIGFYMLVKGVRHTPSTATT